MAKLTKTQKFIRKVQHIFSAPIKYPEVNLEDINELYGTKGTDRSNIFIQKIRDCKRLKITKYSYDKNLSLHSIEVEVDDYIGTLKYNFEEWYKSENIYVVVDGIIDRLVLEDFNEEEIIKIITA